MAEEKEIRFLLWEDGIDYTQRGFSLLYDSINDLREDTLENGIHITQGYFPVEEGLKLAERFNVDVNFEPIEARLRFKKGKHIFTMKSPGGLVRSDFPDGGIEIPKEVFEKYWPLTEGDRTEKLRLKKPFKDYEYEIDMHLDRNLIRAEVEDDMEVLRRVIPIGKEVTNDSRYNGRNLAM